ncbi:MAG: hypothetical protein AB1531_09065 [Chloroflexota bacterium]
MPASQTELLFPPRLIPELAELRGATWRDLVTATVKLADSSLEQTAFVLLMARLANCSTCNANTYRAAQGCTECSKHVIKHFHGSDEDLVSMFETAKSEVKEYLHRSWSEIAPSK